MNQKKPILLTELCDNVAHYLENMGYAKGTLGVYRATWNKLIAYSRHGCYDPEVCKTFLLDVCFVDPESETKQLNRTMRGALRHVSVLREYAETESISRRYSRAGNIQDCPFYATLYGKYCAYFETCGYSYSWLKSTYVALRLFSNVLKNRKIYLPEQIDSHAVLYFIQITGNMSETFKRIRYTQVKEYLHWLKCQGILQNDYSDLFPKVHSKPSALPQIWSEENISKMIAAIDRESPIGKRDYAIFLLLARTGLRISDIVNLEFSNLDWRRNTISLIQCKTKQPLTLPLSKEIGLAIISYTKYSRPRSTSQKIFICHLAPFESLAYHNNFSNEFRKYMRRAGISLKTDVHNGVHTLRHSFATNLLKKGISLKEISDIVGHSNVQSTSLYLRLDTNQLKLCALDVEV